MASMPQGPMRPSRPPMRPIAPPAVPAVPTTAGMVRPQMPPRPALAPGVVQDGTHTYVPVGHSGAETLVIVENGTAHVYPLAGRQEWTFGRANDQHRPDIAVRSSIVSREHGRFLRHDGGWYYQPNRTTNPTFIDGMRLAPDMPPRLLRDGDIIRVDYAIEKPDDDGVFIVFTVDQHLGQWTSYPLRAGSTFIGRAPAADTIVQQVPYVSRRHARIDRTARGYVIRDMGSRIGTYLNDMPVRGAMPLREKDVITIGDCRFYYTRGSIVYDRRTTVAAAPVAAAPQVLQPATLPGIPRPTPAVPLLKATGAPVQATPVVEDGVMIDVNVTEKHVRHRKRITLLKDIHCTIREHSMVAIIGTSGAGKTLLLNCLSGKDHDFVGSTLLRGQDIKNNHRRLRSAIGYVRQSNVFSAPLTVHEELMSSARLRLPDDYTKAQLEEKVEYVLDALNLTEHQNKAIRTLSGGQQRRVSVAREFIGFPSVLFLDEPDAGLSYLDKKALFTQLQTIVRTGRERSAAEDATVSTVIMVVHEIDMLDMFDQVIIIAAPPRADGAGREPGQLAFSGRPAEAKAYFKATDYRDMFDHLQTQLDQHRFQPYGTPEEDRR